jgi:PilZ domain
MIRPSDPRTPDRELGAMVDDIRVRVINCSAAGCLLESDRRIAEGTIATLQLSIGGRTFSEVAEVVRCQPVDRRNGLYHVGAQFLSTAAPHAGSLRHAMRRECSELAGWLMGGIASNRGTNVPCGADNQTSNVGGQT